MQALRLAFLDANLKWNPFGAPTPDDRVALALTRVPPPPPATATQIVGGAGAGKSSSLEALARTMPSATWLYVREDRTLDVRRGAWLHGALAGAADLLVDEAQRMTPRDFRRLVDAIAAASASAGGAAVVVTTPDDLRPRLPPALAPTLATVTLSSCPRDLVAGVIEARLRWARRDPAGDVPRPPPELVDELIARHAPSVRAIEDELYVWYQRRFA